METTLGLVDVRRAWEARDPDLSQLVIRLVRDPAPTPETPPPEGTLTWDEVYRELRSYAFKRKKLAERDARRRALIAQLEAGPEEAMPDRLRVHEILMTLWRDNGAYARQRLLEVIAEVPLTWGPWRALKVIFKEAEERGDYEIYGALTARFDVAYARWSSRSDVHKATIGYMVRRGWRTLRRIAQTLPACYADAAVDVLRFYPENTNWLKTWVANHIFYHEEGKYGRRGFKYWRRPSTLLKYRAFAELWRRSPRPLFSLLERAHSEQARRFAIDALKSDFRASLREVEAPWVVRLIEVGSRIVDEFVIWLLDNVPRFEQSAFRTEGLHTAVLKLLDSPSDNARSYAAKYARTHARDLELDELIRLANNDHDAVRKMSRDLLRDRDPRKDVGLDGWGRLLGSPYGHDLATASLAKHFGARELTPEWFAERLKSDNSKVVNFATEQLRKIHPDKKLGAQYYRDLLDAPELHRYAVRFALDALERFPITADDMEFIRRTLVNPACTSRVKGWIDEGRVKPADVGHDFFKIIAFHGTWSESDWVKALKESGRVWARDLEFSDGLSGFALGLLADVRLFSADQVGFDWLMQLVERTEPRYHDFAVTYMTKAFLPADFAEKEEGADAPAEEASADGEINIDLEGQSFVFTGKLMTMTRSQAQRKVTDANGKNASGVNGKLDYLVIGDDGSPLYGNGRKGSKMLKAEKLQAGGAPIKIISETAFLKMLSGEATQADEGSTEAGCERLWAMLLADGKAIDESPLARFALHYLRLHHPEICAIETERYVDPGAEIPDDFLSFDRVRGLLADSRERLRQLGLEYSRYEFARWSPPMEALVELSELPYPEIRQFVFEALTAEESTETRRFRVDPKVLTADAVYQFCESTDASARGLGMALIARNPRLAIPEELFRLTESPDRQVRAFVVRQLWHLYRERGITEGWLPPAPPAPKVKKRRGAKKQQAEDAPKPQGAPAKPENPPASPDDLQSFLRRTLFGIPPAKLPRPAEGKRKKRTLPPLPARKAKLALVDVVRDLALEDQGFAEKSAPLLQEFLGSRGQSERAACLVALTRMRRAWPDLDCWKEA
ncbi:MAG: BRCT domain-containing protein [Bradymonadia bacterium]